jgi:hypothetical protein
MTDECDDTLIIGMYDVAIIGASTVGLSTAYELCQLIEQLHQNESKNDQDIGQDIDQDAQNNAQIRTKRRQFRIIIIDRSDDPLESSQPINNNHLRDFRTLWPEQGGKNDDHISLFQRSWEKYQLLQKSLDSINSNQQLKFDPKITDSHKLIPKKPLENPSINSKLITPCGIVNLISDPRTSSTMWSSKLIGSSQIEEKIGLGVKHFAKGDFVNEDGAWTDEFDMNITHRVIPSGILDGYLVDMTLNRLLRGWGSRGNGLSMGSVGRNNNNHNHYNEKTENITNVQFTYNSSCVDIENISNGYNIHVDIAGGGYDVISARKIIVSCGVETDKVLSLIQKKLECSIEKTGVVENILPVCYFKPKDGYNVQNTAWMDLQWASNEPNIHQYSGLPPRCRSIYQKLQPEQNSTTLDNKYEKKLPTSNTNINNNKTTPIFAPVKKRESKNDSNSLESSNSSSTISISPPNYDEYIRIISCKPAPPSGGQIRTHDNIVEYITPRFVGVDLDSMQQSLLRYQQSPGDKHVIVRALFKNDKDKIIENEKDEKDEKNNDNFFIKYSTDNENDIIGVAGGPIDRSAMVVGYHVAQMLISFKNGVKELNNVNYKNRFEIKPRSAAQIL